MIRTVASALSCGIIGLFLGRAGQPSADAKPERGQMRLGNFSVSLTVKDIAKAREFYEKLGFRQCGGDQAQNWLVLENETARIGLFQGMFDKNLLTFNPGWDRDAKPLADFEDVREIQKELKSRGLGLKVEADEKTSGPAYLMVVDPDGNPILIDQHVPKPARK
jgi:catechol 2,3-dioxygenase-like lactoylglutathione lyase family enzyme